MSLASWELERGLEPSLHWICAVCLCPSVEHPTPWWGCAGRWLDRKKAARELRDYRVGYIIGALFGGAR